MSGEKEGRVDPPPREPDFLPLIGAGVLAGAAIGGAAIGFGMATRGLFRLGKQTYDRIDAYVEEAVARDLKEQLERIEAYKGQVQGYEGAPASSHEEIERISDDRLEQARQEKLIQGLKKLTETRKEDEKQKGLRNDLSQEFEKRIEELHKQQVRQHPRTTVSKKVKEDAALKRLEQEINDKLKLIQAYDLLFVEEQRAQMANLRQSKKAYQKKLNDLNRKWERVMKAQDPLHTLNKLYLKLTNHPLSEQFINAQEKEEIRKSLQRSISEVGKSPESDEAIIQEFSNKVGSILHQARSREMEARFKENRDRLTDSMSRSGYRLIKEKDHGTHLQLQYASATDRKKSVMFSLKKPECENDSLSDFSMKVAEQGYDSDAQRRIEGEKIMKELESSGIRVDYYDLTAAIDPEADKEKVLRYVKKQIMEKQGLNSDDVQVTWSSEADLMINGNRVSTAAKSVVNVVHDYLQLAGSQKTRQAEPERLKEGN